VIDLDDEHALTAADPGGMLGLVADLPSQCREGIARGSAVASPPSSAGLRAVVFAGVGGSGVAGEVVRALYADTLEVPVVVVRSARLPEFCGPDTLVVCSSYSGGTAETLACFGDARERGARIVAVTSGGALAERAAGEGAGLVRLPQGLMPRAAFGLLAFGAIGALSAIGVLGSPGDGLEPALAELETLAGTLAPSVPTRVNEAKRVARAIGQRVPVIWGAEGIAAVAATRWKTQINENAKAPAFAAALPELDHNEVVGWSERAGDRFAVVALRHDGEDADVTARFPPSLAIAEASGADVREVWARGEGRLSRLLSLVMIGDFASTYLGLARGHDPTPIDAIVRLKEALAQA
jgi:glucose/mannose-6-phosphate isomerase